MRHGSARYRRNHIGKLTKMGLRASACSKRLEHPPPRLGQRRFSRASSQVSLPTLSLFLASHEAASPSAIGSSICNCYSEVYSPRPLQALSMFMGFLPLLPAFLLLCFVWSSHLAVVTMEVATVVTSIISAYGNGRDLFRRMLGKKSNPRGRAPTLSEEEAWLRDSLDQRPLQIRDSYDSSVERFGHRFEVGDTAAHTSLAHTLLVLNSGLISLINDVLHRDSKYSRASSRALYDLSEVAAKDTVDALSQLSLRLTSRPGLDTRSLNPPQNPSETKARSKPSQNSQKKRPGPSPLVQRAWIRPKSSSVVSTSTTKSSKGKPRHERSTSEPAVPAASKKNISRSRVRSPSPSKHESQDRRRRSGKYQESVPRREQSMLIVPSDLFPSQWEEDMTETASPLAPTIPHYSRPSASRRPRPLSAATFMTASTKIGEIPEGLAAYSAMTPVEQHAQHPRLAPHTADKRAALEEKPTRIRRGFKFWKKDQKPVALTAC